MPGHPAIVVLLGVCSLALAAPFPQPHTLRTELRPPGETALSVPTTGVRMSWELTGAQRGDTQSAWQVQLVRQTDGHMTWDSGQQMGTSQQVTLPVGQDLFPETAYQWTVRSWFADSATPTPWSENLLFSTAPEPSSWATRGARWIGGNNELRSFLTLPSDKRAVSAKAYVSGLGAFYLYLNGERVGDHVMDPPQTVYPYRVQYSTFDVLSLLKPGNNSVGAMLGNYKWGYTDVWCNMTTAGGADGCRALIMQVVVVLDDGTVMTHSSNASNWVRRQSAVVWDHLFHGETYDARLDGRGQGEGWLPAVDMPHIPGLGDQAALNPVGPLQPVASPPLKIEETFSAISVRAVSPGRFVFDFGQNVAGFVTLQLSSGHGLAVGTAIMMEHGEISRGAGDVDPGDTFNTFCHPNPATSALRSEPCAPHQTYGVGHNLAGYGYIGDFNNANMSNVYIVGDSTAAVSYTPLFTAAGFRYVTLSGLPPSFIPSTETLVSHFVHTAVTHVGKLTLPAVSAIGNGTSSTPDVLNQIHHLVRYAQLSNLWSVPTDCPQRERRGWMGDAQVSSNEAMLNFDMQAFYESFLHAMRDTQLWGCAARHNDGGSTCGGQTTQEAAGSLPDVVPFDGIGGSPGCPVWSVAYIVIARNYWRHYGDATPLRAHYAGLEALMGYFERHAAPGLGLIETDCYGDWVCVGADGGCPRTPAGSVSSFYHALAYGYLEDIAVAIGNTTGASLWRSKHGTAVKAWHSRYYNSTVGGYSPVDGEPRGSQTSNSMALALGAPPDQVTRAATISALVENVEANGRHFTFGIVGSAWLFPALSSAGRGDLALSILMGDSYPSFGHMVQQNMTTLCENWKCEFHDAGGGSQNHIMYGAFDEWMVTGLGGLTVTSNASFTGWEHFTVHPDPYAATTLGEGRFSIHTRFGVAAVQWVYDSVTHTVHTNVTVPVGSSATVISDQVLPQHGCQLEAVSESGRVIWTAETESHQHTLALDPATMGVDVGSGLWLFERVYSCP